MFLSISGTIPPIFPRYAFLFFWKDLLRLSCLGVSAFAFSMQENFTLSYDHGLSTFVSTQLINIYIHFETFVMMMYGLRELPKRWIWWCYCFCCFNFSKVCMGAINGGWIGDQDNCISSRTRKDWVPWVLCYFQAWVQFVRFQKTTHASLKRVTYFQKIMNKDCSISLYQCSIYPQLCGFLPLILENCLCNIFTTDWTKLVLWWPIFWSLDRYFNLNKGLFSCSLTWNGSYSIELVIFPCPHAGPCKTSTVPLHSMIILHISHALSASCS